MAASCLERILCRHVAFARDLLSDPRLPLQRELWRLVAGNGLTLSAAVDLCEQLIIQAALRAEDGNRTRAARRLGIHVRTIFKKLILPGGECPRASGARARRADCETSTSARNAIAERVRCASKRRLGAKRGIDQRRFRSQNRTCDVVPGGSCCCSRFRHASPGRCRSARTGGALRCVAPTKRGDGTWALG